MGGLIITSVDYFGESNNIIYIMSNVAIYIILSIFLDFFESKIMIYLSRNV